MQNHISGQQIIAHPEHVCSEEGAVFLPSQLFVAFLRQWSRSGGAQAQDGPQLLTNGLLLLWLHLCLWRLYLKDTLGNVEKLLRHGALFKGAKEIPKMQLRMIT